MKTLAAGSPLPLFSGCEGFIDNLDLSADAVGTGFTGGQFVKHFLGYRVVRVREDLNYRGARPTVTPLVIRALKKEQSKLKKAAAAGQKEVLPKLRNDSRVAREKAARYRAEARTKKAIPSPRETRPGTPAPEPEEIQDLEQAAIQETAKAESWEAQLASLEKKVSVTLAAATADIGLARVNDSLFEIDIPTETLTDTIYIAPDETQAPEGSDLVAQTDRKGPLPVVEG